MNKRRLPPKVQGEVAELAFMSRAAALGHRVLLPYGDNAPYDAVIDNGSRFVRVQVKSVCRRVRAGIYQIQTKHGGEQRAYCKGEVDVVAAHLVDEDSWFLIPEKVFAGKTAVYVGGKRGNNEEYREGWGLLGHQPGLKPNRSGAKVHRPEGRCVHPNRHSSLRSE